LKISFPLPATTSALYSSVGRNFPFSSVLALWQRLRDTALHYDLRSSSPLTKEAPMNRIAIALLAALALVSAALAQSTNPYNGKWTISFDGRKTADLAGTVVVKDEGGVWDVVARSSNNPCVGREYPITVQKTSADELTFTVNRAKTLTGCKDSMYTFRKVDDKTMKGELGEGRAASLVRN
jgi:hypothetical protein